MAMNPLQDRRDGVERPIGVPARVLAALDLLDDAEQAAVRQVLRELQRLPAGSPADPRLRRLPGDEPIYVVHAAPEVRLFVRWSHDGPTEVLDLVRSDTLQRMFSTRDVPASRL